MLFYTVLGGGLTRDPLHYEVLKGVAGSVCQKPKLLDQLRELHEHLQKVKKIYEKDLANDWGRVQMPDALNRKYPSAPAEWPWIFPQERR